MNMLKSALQHEVRASVLYNRAIDITNNEEAKSLFIELAGFEDDHAKKIIRTANGYEGVDAEELEKHLDWLEKEFEKGFTVKENETLKHGDIKDVLAMAISMEESARDAYADLVNSASDGDLKKFCEAMVTEEQSHANSLEQALTNVDIEPEDRAGL